MDWGHSRSLIHGVSAGEKTAIFICHTKQFRIPIYAQDELVRLIKDLAIEDCIFSYSDVPYQVVMNLSAVVNAAGANFVLLGPERTMIKSTKPVIAVGAVRTGCGKSQTSRRTI